MLCKRCTKMCFQTGITSCPLPKEIFFPTATDFLNLPWFQIHQDAGLGFLCCPFFPFYSIFCCKFCIFNFSCYVNHYMHHFFGWKKWIMKNKHFTDLVWILCICLVIIRWWAWGVVRDWGKTKLTSYKMHFGSPHKPHIIWNKSTHHCGSNKFPVAGRQVMSWWHEVKSSTVI